ncbi:MAG: STAS domain-containing protein [Anaerolineae bacterium]|nr:STAS domain-containing protein [Anaerolineae bacterium]MCI0609938.1 STAS domain-containing protein [Anaerolineae bacterium]
MPIKVFTQYGRVPITVIQVQGSIDASTYEEFQARVDKVIENGARYVLVDLIHSPFVSSYGLRALYSLYNRLRSVHPDSELSEAQVRQGISAGTYKSPHLKLLNLSREIRISFEMGGFDMFIETYDDMKTALASF